MRSLTRRDLSCILTSIQQLHACDKPDAFAFEVLAMLLGLVPAKGASFNRLEMRPVRLLCQMYPKRTLEPLTEESRKSFLQFQDQHPFVSLYRQIGGFGAVRTSDLMSQRQFERLAIYNEYYRRFDSHFQIEFTLPAPRDVCFAIALNRADKDFSERDRAVLELLRPHIAAGYRAMRMQLELNALEQCADPSRGAVLISAKGRVRYFTASAVSLMEKYFGKTAHLPDEISRWLGHRERLLASEGCLREPVAPLLIERGAHRLEVQARREGDGLMLLLCESAAPPSHSRLTEMGLTPRQAQVLYWIAQGKTNAEIGTILGASHHTIHQHVNAILRKLGVENRGTAMLRALEVLGLQRSHEATI